MKKLKYLGFLYLVFTILLIPSLVTSQDVNFTASVSNNPVTQGETFKLTYSINTEGSNFRPPSFNGFSVLSGPSRSSSMQIINGQVSRSLSYTYLLRAEKTGSYTINPASIQVEGKRVRSNSIDLRVVEPSEAEKRRRQQEKEREETLQSKANKIIKDNLYLRTNVSKRNAYVGEQITATFKLYVNSELNLVNLENRKSPVFNGFWSQEIEQGELQWKTEQVNGVWFKVATLKQVVLFPQQSGNLKIDPYEFKSIVRLRTSGQSRRRSMFDDFFNRGSYKDFEYIVSSEPINVNVKSLPDNPPESFTGAVGDINMNAWVDITKTKTNEPVTLKVKVSGNGNLKLINSPNINIPPDFESFDPKIADNTTVSLSGMRGDKIFEYLLIPRTTGEYKIGPIEFTYFDLKSEEYKTQKSEEFIITVEKGSGEQYSNVSGINREELKLLGKDIRYIKSDTELIKRSEMGFFGTQIFYILLALPLLLFLIFIIFYSKRRKESENVALLRNKKANKFAKKRLSVAGDALKKSEKNEFYEEISKALWGYISDKLDIPVSKLNKDTAKSELQKLNIDEEIISDFLTTLDESEFARYSPGANEEAKMNEVYDRAGRVITDIERGIR